MVVILLKHSELGPKLEKLPWSTELGTLFRNNHILLIEMDNLQFHVWAYPSDIHSFDINHKKSVHLDILLNDSKKKATNMVILWQGKKTNQVDVIIMDHENIN